MSGGDLEIFTVTSRVTRGDRKETQWPWVQLGHPVPGVRKCGDLTIYKIESSPLIREGAQNEEAINAKLKKI
jgi:hypothetical protein